MAAKLPPVALGGELQDQIKDQERQILKLSETIKSLQTELIQAKKAQGNSGANEDYEREIDALKAENTVLIVLNNNAGRDRRDERQV